MLSVTNKTVYELIALDEVGCVPLADIGAEFLFHVTSERPELVLPHVPQASPRRRNWGREGTGDGQVLIR